MWRKRDARMSNASRSVFLPIVQDVEALPRGIVNVYVYGVDIQTDG